MLSVMSLTIQYVHRDNMSVYQNATGFALRTQYFSNFFSPGDLALKSVIVFPLFWKLCPLSLSPNLFSFNVFKMHIYIFICSQISWLLAVILDTYSAFSL